MRRAHLFAAALLASGLASRGAFAGDSACTDVRVAVRGSAGGTTPAKIMETILAEVASHPDAPCDGPRAVAAIAVECDSGRVATVRVELSRDGYRLVAEREVDLARAAQDAAPLALAIAADELLGEARAKAADEAESARWTGDAQASLQPRGEAPALAPPPLPRWRFGGGVATEWFSSGAALAGPDATLERALDHSLLLSLRVGLRAATEDARANDHLALTSAGAWLRLGILGDARAGAGVAAGLDVLTVVSAAGDVRATAIPGASLVGWYPIASWCHLGADLGSGYALTTLGLASGAVVRGAELRTRVSFAVDF